MKIGAIILLICAVSQAEEIKNIGFGNSILLNCTDAVEDQNSVHWFKLWFDVNGNSLSAGWHEMMGSSWNADKMSVDFDAHTFTISNVTYSDAGHYKCARKGSEDYYKLFQVNVYDRCTIHADCGDHAKCNEHGDCVCKEGFEPGNPYKYCTDICYGRSAPRCGENEGCMWGECHCYSGYRRSKTTGLCVAETDTCYGPSATICGENEHCVRGECRCNMGNIRSNTTGLCIGNCSLIDETAETGVIQSAGWPHQYPNYYDCNWIIQGALGQVVVIHFDEILYLEEADDCRYDYIEVIDATGTLGKNCGSSLADKTLVSNTHWFHIIFHSDNTINNGGFKITWTKKDCDDKKTLKQCKREVKRNRCDTKRNKKNCKKTCGHC